MLVPRCHGTIVHLSACWCHGASLTHSRNFLLQARQHCTVSFSPSSTSPSSPSPSPSSSSTSSSSSHQITELARNKMLLHYINHHSLQPQPKIHQCFSNSHNFPLFPAFIFTKQTNLNDMMSRVTAVERPLMSLAPLHCFNH